MPIRVVHLLNKLTFGGTEKVIVNLLTYSDSHVQNFICCLEGYDEKFIEEITKDKREAVFSINKKAGQDFSMPFKVASLCREHSVDIIHSLGWGTYAEGLLAAKLLMRKRFIYSFRGKTQEDTVHIPQRRILAQRFFAKFCDAIITPSHLSRLDYAQTLGINPDKIQVIYNGVNTAQYNPVHDVSAMNIRKKFGIDPGSVVIGSVARFDPVKNMAGLIRAFASMTIKIQRRCLLLLVGDGPESGYIKNLVSSLGLDRQVIFTGMSRNVSELLQAMDIYVQPSRFEGVPNALLEAMAAGKPVLATDVGGIPEIVIQGVTGKLIPVDDTEKLSSEIQELAINSPKRRKMGEEGRARTVSHFSIQKMISDYEALYEQILSQ